MTFSNPAYGPGIHVRCDNCRDPDALMEGRPGSEYIAAPTVGTDAATERAVEVYGFVRQPDGRVLCGGCAAAERASTD